MFDSINFNGINNENYDRNKNHLLNHRNCSLKIKLIFILFYFRYSIKLNLLKY